MTKLKDILSLTNDWLKFAEAKNAFVAAASSVALWSAVRLLSTEIQNCYIGAYLISLSFFLLVAFISAVLSFLPVLSYRWIVPTTGEVANENVLYFGYLASLSKQELIKKYIAACNVEEKELEEIDRMYAEQIIINSRIALAKYGVFEISIKLLICAVLTPVFGPLLLCLAKKKRKEIDGI